MIEFDVEEMKKTQEEEEMIARVMNEKIKKANRTSRLLMFGCFTLVMVVWTDAILNNTPVHQGWLLLLAFNYLVDVWKVGR